MIELAVTIVGTWAVIYIGVLIVGLAWGALLCFLDFIQTR